MEPLVDLVHAGVPGFSAAAVANRQSVSVIEPPCVVEHPGQARFAHGLVDGGRNLGRRSGVLAALQQVGGSTHAIHRPLEGSLVLDGNPAAVDREPGDVVHRGPKFECLRRARHRGV